MRIYFVDKMPDEFLKRLDKGAIITGKIVHDHRTRIYVMKISIKISSLLLLHELCHWIVYLLSNSERVHDLIDKHFIIKSGRHFNRIHKDQHGTEWSEHGL